MNHAHLAALEERHAQLERRIHEEDKRPACDNLAIRRMKREKLHLKEEISRMQEKDSLH